MYKLKTYQLRILFNEFYNTTELVEELLDLLSETKQRKFIIDKFNYDMTKGMQSELIKSILT